MSQSGTSDRPSAGYSVGRAISIGVVCIFSYFVSYYSRQLLGVSTPAMTESGLFTKDFLGLMSSVYMITYAAGQLVNGIVGDLLNPKKMIAAGLFASGALSMIFPFLPFDWMRVICFSGLGFSLSMLRGPLVKTISENTSKNHSRVICTFFSCASFAGPFFAGLLAMIFDWRYTFFAAGCITLVIAVCAISVLTVFEGRGYVSYSVGKNQGIKGVFQVFRIEKFFFYMAIGAIVETSITAVSFWVPSYLVEHLGYSKEMANTVYAVIFFFKGMMPFVALALFRALKENDLLLMRTSFSLAVLFYAGVIFVSHPWVNVAFLALALMAVGCASSLLWSIYIPGLGKTGRVSSINGILDCTGYIVAALCNAVFGFVAQYLNWTGVVIIWGAIAFVGVAVTFIHRKKQIVAAEK